MTYAKENSDTRPPHRPVDTYDEASLSHAAARTIQIQQDMVVVGDDRQTRRRNIKARLADIDKRKAKLAELTAAMGRIDETLASATKAHSEAVAPLKVELEAIEKRQVTDILSDVQEDTAREQRRKELEEQIQSLDIEQNQRVEASKHQKKLLAKEKGDPSLATAAGTALLNALVREADPKLVDEQWVTSNTQRHANARANAARSRIEAIRADLPKVRGRDKEILERRLQRWQLDLTSAAEILGQADRRQEELRAKMIDE